MSTLQAPRSAPPPPTPAREQLRTLMRELAYDAETVQAIADAVRAAAPAPPWDDAFLRSVCAAIDVLRAAERTAGQVRTRVAGFRQAAEQGAGEDWRGAFWRAELDAA